MSNKILSFIKSKFAQQPILQAFTIVGLGLVLLLLERLFGLIGIIELTPNFAWEVLAMGIFLYALFNNILSLSSENPSRYWALSILGFFVLFALLAGMAYFITGVFITELDIFKNILFVLSLGYLIIASIVRTIRFLLEWAKKQDEFRDR
jgi:hypothetical protein